jgi:ribosome-binding protein aMBF1 (putative translation factor)
MAAKIVAERSLTATKAALSYEKSTRERGDRALREAQAVVKELEGRLETARQAAGTTQAELAAERQARLKDLQNRLTLEMMLSRRFSEAVEDLGR